MHLITSGLGSGFLISGGLGSSGTPPTSPIIGYGHPGYFTGFAGDWRTGYFPGSSGLPGGLIPDTIPGVVGYGYPGYFTGFAGGWRTGYFPGSSGVFTGLALDTLPATFLAAVRGALKSDTSLMGMINNNIWHRYAPRGVPEPLMVYQVTTENRTNSSYHAFIQPGQLQIIAYAQQDQLARDAANRAVSRLTDSRLAWSAESGRLMYMTLNSPVSTDMPVLGYGGSKVFAATRVLDFVYQGVEAFG